jgi:hypothetical protein
MICVCVCVFARLIWLTGVTWLLTKECNKIRDSFFFYTEFLFAFNYKFLWRKSKNDRILKKF